MLDHHFAERHPAHEHYYAGAASAEHSHPFEHSHAHQSAGLYGPFIPSSEGIVFFAPNDGLGAGSADLAAPLAMQSPRFSDGDGASLLRSPGRDEAALLGTIVAHPKRPPRA